MITKGSKIKLIKEMGLFKNIGEICEVTDVAEGGIITFKFGGRHLGCMSYDEYLRFFEPVIKPVKPKRNWTTWKLDKVSLNDFDGKRTIVFYEYRSNGKTIQVRTRSIKAEASCHEDDKFDLQKGLDLAVKRLIVKVLKEKVEQQAKEM